MDVGIYYCEQKKKLDSKMNGSINMDDLPVASGNYWTVVTIDIIVFDRLLLFDHLR